MEQLAKMDKRWSFANNRLHAAEHKDVVYLICILAITVIAFFPTFFNDFQMQWDDQWQVKNSFTTGEYNLWNFLFSENQGYMGQFSPLNQFIYTVLYNIGGYNPFLFHATCLAFHLCNVICLHFMLGRILTDCTSLDTERIFNITSITTLFFAIHPLQVESIAWVSASKIVLFSFFYLLSSMMLVFFVKKQKIGYYLVTLICFLFSYLSKEQAVTFPLWATILYIIYGISYRNRFFWFTLIPIYFLSFLFIIHLVVYVSSYTQVLQSDPYYWWQRVLLFFYSLTTYFSKSLIPINLSWMYVNPFPEGSAMPSSLVFYPLIYAFFLFLLWDYLKKNYILIPLLFIFIHLLPVLNITRLPRSAIVADRYMYLPIIGLALIFSYFLTSHRCCMLQKKWKYTLLFIIIVTFVSISFCRTGRWHDSVKLKSNEEIQLTK